MGCRLDSRRLLFCLVLPVAAFDENKEIGLIIELNDGVNGRSDTTIVQIIKVTKFASGGEKDGKMTAQIEAEKMGNPIISVAE